MQQLQNFWKTATGKFAILGGGIIALISLCLVCTIYSVIFRDSDNSQPEANATQVAADVFATQTAMAPITEPADTATPEPADTATPEPATAISEVATPTPPQQEESTPSGTTAPTAPAVITSASSTLQLVRERGVLRCGVNGDLIGFSYLDSESGTMQGFDADICRAVASAVLGDNTKVEFIPLTAGERFPALQNGEIELLSRNTTWNMARDTSMGLNFGPIVFYDAQMLMVRAESGIESIDDIPGISICVQQGTTTETNLELVFDALGISYNPITFPSAVEAREAYDAQECDALTADGSSLMAQRFLLADPIAHVLVPGVYLSEEPLAPVVREGDDQWFDIMQWVVLGLIAAERYEVTAENVEQLAEFTFHPYIQSLLGATDTLGENLGLQNDFMVTVIEQNGNYAEVYERNLGLGSPLILSRGMNAQWYDGGLLFAPPFR